MIALIGDSGEPRALVLMALIAFFVGASKAVLTRNEKTGFIDIIACAIISAAAGLGVGCGGLYLWGPDRLLMIFPLSSVAGWMGVVLFDVVGGAALRHVQSRVESSLPAPINGQPVDGQGIRPELPPPPQTPPTL